MIGGETMWDSVARRQANKAVGWSYDSTVISITVMIISFILSHQFTRYLFLFLFMLGDCLQCYQCNSAFNKTCDDPFNKTAYPEFLKDCPPEAKYCRKINQKGECTSQSFRHHFIFLQVSMQYWIMKLNYEIFWTWNLRFGPLDFSWYSLWWVCNAEICYTCLSSILSFKFANIFLLIHELLHGLAQTIQMICWNSMFHCLSYVHCFHSCCIPRH